MASHQLQELYLGGPEKESRGIPQEELAALFNSNPELQIVFLKRLVLSADNMKTLGNVKELKISDCQLTANTFEGYEKKKIQVLSHSNCEGLTSEMLRTMASIGTLCKLYLGSLALPKDTLEILKNCRELKLLHLFDCQNLDVQWPHLIDFPSMTTLQLDCECPPEVSDKLTGRSVPVMITVFHESEPERPTESEEESDELY